MQEAIISAIGPWVELPAPLLHITASYADFICICFDAPNGCPHSKYCSTCGVHSFRGHSASCTETPSVPSWYALFAPVTAANMTQPNKDGYVMWKTHASQLPESRLPVKKGRMRSDLQGGRQMAHGGI